MEGWRELCGRGREGGARAKPGNQLVQYNTMMAKNNQSHSSADSAT